VETHSGHLLDQLSRNAPALAEGVGAAEERDRPMRLPTWTAPDKLHQAYCNSPLMSRGAP